MSEQEAQIKLMEALVERDEATEFVVRGIPGICLAALVAPDCIMVCDWTPGIPVNYCLN